MYVYLPYKSSTTSHSPICAGPRVTTVITLQYTPVIPFNYYFLFGHHYSRTYEMYRDYSILDESWWDPSPPFPAPLFGQNSAARNAAQVMVVVSFLMYFRASWTMCQWVFRWRKQQEDGHICGRLGQVAGSVSNGSFGSVCNPRMVLTTGLEPDLTASYRARSLESKHP